jgi:glutathione S-transferase
VQDDIDRITAIWTGCRERHGAEGPMLFGRFGIADAFYAPVVMRFFTYAVDLPPVCLAYAEAVSELPAMREWIDAAKRETAFLAGEEPYASQAEAEAGAQQRPPSTAG